MPDSPADFTTGNPAPIMGVAAVHARDTEHDTPSQQAGWPNGHWPGVDTITSVVDIQDILSGSGYYGGPMPLHSIHWSNYFAQEWQNFPMGKTPAFVSNPDPTGVMAATSDSQNMGSGNSADYWSVMKTTFRNAWQKNWGPNNYK